MKWEELALKMKGVGHLKSPKQCRERWLHHLNPDLSKEKWTLEENKRLFELQKVHGSRWKEIATFFPKRTDNGIKNQFFSIIRKSLRKACKASNITIGSNIINSVKPKILSQFLETPLRVQSQALRAGSVEPFRMRDFVQKFAFNKMNELRFCLAPEEKELLWDCFRKMQAIKLVQKRTLRQRKTEQKVPEGTALPEQGAAQSVQGLPEQPEGVF